MSVFETISKVAREIWRIGSLVLPIVQAFRQTVPEIDAVFDKVDGAIDLAGSEADDFIDRNVEVLTAIEDYAGHMIDFAAELRTTVRFAKLAAGDDTITLAEAEVLGRHVLALKDAALAFAGDQTDELIDALAELE
jgi:hypothetical protein